jgi:uncharacterized membrane protein YgcG
MKRFMCVIVVFIVLSCIGVSYANPPEQRGIGGDGGDAFAISSSTSRSASDASAIGIGLIDVYQPITVSPQQTTTVNPQQSINVQTPDKINFPIKYHDSEISPRDPATYEGPWMDSGETWNTMIFPWEVKDTWTKDETKNFPDGNTTVILGLYKTNEGFWGWDKTVDKVQFKSPKQIKGISDAGIVRIICQNTRCGPEDLHSAAVKTAYDKGLAYLQPIKVGYTPIKSGGDRSFRIGGGGGGITGDGGVSGGGGIGWGSYEVGPGLMPWVIFKAWIYTDEHDHYTK